MNKKNRKWWDYYGLKKPTIIKEELFNGSYLTTFTEEISGVPIRFIPSEKVPHLCYGVENAPMFTNYLTPYNIYFNNNFNQYKFGIYHEVGHCLTLSNINKKPKRRFLIDAEYEADKMALALAIENKDEDIINDLANIIIIDRIECQYYKRKEHYYARLKLLLNESFIYHIKKYIDLDKILLFAYDWENLLKEKYLKSF
jgi:hypothetical protein